MSDELTKHRLHMREHKHKRRGSEASQSAHKKARHQLQHPTVVFTDAQRQQLQAERQRLPIWSAKEKLVELVKTSRTTVLVGETGSGKTTQLPQFLLEAGFAHKGAIACTQPRRVAAISVARRVADELGVAVGTKVGYSIRFEDRTSPHTRLKYMTDGMLLREALLDGALSKYQVVIIDEAHERTVQTDVLLGLLKNVQKRRGDDFRLIIMSATLDAAKFVSYFPGAQGAYIQGRTFPVQLYYTAKPEENYVDAAMNAVLQVHHEEGPGDILLFLTGQDEIESLDKLLSDRAASLPPAGPAKLNLMVVPIYASMPPEQQMQVFNLPPEGFRKAILATNIAETSITISGVRYVIDTGQVKARGYNARLGADSLDVVPVSQAQARQRSGRAGREAPGKAYRLYTEKDFDVLAPTTVPEIQRSNLSSVVLQLKAMGINDVLGFDFMDPPPRAAVIRSLELLLALGALDAQGSLTPLGTNLSKLPVDPMFGKVLLGSGSLGCSIEAMQVVAMISTDNIFFSPRNKRDEANAARNKFVSRDGDHATLMNVLRAFIQVAPKQQAEWCSDNFINVRSVRKATDIYQQLEGHMQQLSLPLVSCGEDTTPLRRALVSGLFTQAARKQPDGTYKVISSGQQVWIHPSSVLCSKKPECIVFSELVRTTKQYARDVSVIEPRWLPELAPGYFAAKAVPGATAPGQAEASAAITAGTNMAGPKVNSGLSALHGPGRVTLGFSNRA